MNKFWLKNKYRVVIAATAVLCFVFGFSVYFLAKQTDLTYYNDTPVKVYTQYIKPQVDKTCPIKGKTSGKGATLKKIYHLAGDPWYAKLKATDCFKTENEAKGAGFKKAGK